MIKSDPKVKLIFHDAFEFGITLKFLNALIEIIAAVVLLAIRPTTIGDWIVKIAVEGFGADSGDWFYTQTLNISNHFVGHPQTFLVFYLASHGIIKIFLVIALWQKKLWAYPLAIWVFGAFGIYQMYRYALTRSQFMIWLTVLDVIVIYLTWIEYQWLKKSQVVV